MGLKRTAAPPQATTLVTPEEARKHLSLPPGDGSHDEHVARLIAVGVDVCERWTGRALLTQSWRLAIDSFPWCEPWEIVLPRPPLQSITSIQYVDEDGQLQTLAAADYDATADAEPGRIAPAYNEVWPATRCEREAVRITYAAGYGATAVDVPEPIRQAILLLVGHWFAQREPVITDTITADIPLSVEFLLEGYRTGANVEWYRLAE